MGPTKVVMEIKNLKLALNESKKGISIEKAHAIEAQAEPTRWLKRQGW